MTALITVCLMTHCGRGGFARGTRRRSGSFVRCPDAQRGSQITVPCTGTFGSAAMYPVWQYRLNQQALPLGLILGCNRHERHVARSMAAAAIGCSNIAGYAIRCFPIRGVPDWPFPGRLSLRAETCAGRAAMLPCCDVRAEEREPPADGHRVNVDVTLDRPTSLPLNVPVIAQSTTPVRVHHDFGEGHQTGIARTVIISDCPTDEVRLAPPGQVTFRPVNG